ATPRLDALELAHEEGGGDVLQSTIVPAAVGGSRLVGGADGDTAGERDRRERDIADGGRRLVTDLGGSAAAGGEGVGAVATNGGDGQGGEDRRSKPSDPPGQLVAGGHTQPVRLSVIAVIGSATA